MKELIGFGALILLLSIAVYIGNDDDRKSELHELQIERTQLEIKILKLECESK